MNNQLLRLLQTATCLSVMLTSPLMLAGKPDCEQDPTHPGCKSGDDPMALPYLVEIKECSGVPPSSSPLYRPFDLDESCLAEAHDHISNFNTVFLLDDRTCAILTTDEDYSVLPAGGINVTRDKKSGAIVEAYFLGRNLAPPSERFPHISENMVNVDTSVEDLGDGSFIIHLHAAEVILNKCDTQRLKHNTVCDENVGTFAIDDLRYYPNPSY